MRSVTGVEATPRQSELVEDLVLVRVIFRKTNYNRNFYLMDWKEPHFDYPPSGRAQCDGVTSTILPSVGLSVTGVEATSRQSEPVEDLVLVRVIF